MALLVNPSDPAPGPVPFRRILGVRVDGLDYARAVAVAAAALHSGAGGYVCAANVHMVMTAFDDPSFRRVLEEALLVTPDGMPLVWALRRLGLDSSSRVYGPDLMEHLCAVAAERGWRVGLLGGTETVARDLRDELLRRFPDLALVYVFSPPFRPPTEAEEEREARAMAAAGVQLLFVGLGCPKQEIWMAARRASVSAVMVGVGAAFDFLSGHKRQAPRWLQRIGMEWLFRLLCEPRRLGRRYLVQNPRFVFHFLRQMIQYRREERAARRGRSAP